MLDVRSLRQQFPALQRNRDSIAPIFLDGPGGTQVPQRVIDAIVRYLTECNANHGGLFATSKDSDAVIASAHQAVADLIHAPSANEVVFGSNMTTLTLHLSRAIGRTLRTGDELLVTRLDHDANVTPWVLAARDAGATVRFVDIHPEDCTLDLDNFRALLSERTRLVAVGCASNAAGTLNDVRTIARLGHQVGAWVFLDAVHYAPHGPIDVQEWDCDFLVCSAYKFFGPHLGILWGRRALLEALPAYKLRPVPETIPDRWMTGTQNHEGLAGVVAAIEYLTELGGAVPSIQTNLRERNDRSCKLLAALIAIRTYERELANKLLEALADRPRYKVWGITDRNQLAWRVPTVAITCNRSPAELAQHLAARQIFVWNGNMYALGLTERLELERQGGFLRIGMVHYNTPEEIDRLIRALDELP
ncbi:MAG TPA: cysteine desulfurase-like protein [Gemmataceae bacterium]|nr:cysteine desulfurase-like protein [Gemmataceae bacterium]